MKKYVKDLHKNPSNNFILAKKLLSDYKMQRPTYSYRIPRFCKNKLGNLIPNTMD